MKILCAVLVIVLSVTLMPQLASATTFVNTTGQAVPEESLGTNCRVSETLPDGRVMVYDKSEADAQILKARLVASGVTDDPTVEKWQRIAQANACQRGAGLNCTGACPGGKTCQTEKKGNYTGCECK